MLKRYSFWLWVAIVFQLLNAVAHSLSFVITPVPNNETERQLLNLMSNYRMDMGAGFHRSMHQLFTALSACFPLLFLLGALNNIYVLRKKVDVGFLKGFLAIQVIIFGICFGLMAVLTFLPPIVMCGLVFIFLAVAFFLTTKEGK
jgi:hypothetical protein